MMSLKLLNMPESILSFMQSTKIIRNYKTAHLHTILLLMSVVYWLAHWCFTLATWDRIRFVTKLLHFFKIAVAA